MKKRNSEPDSADPSEYGLSYGTNRLNLGESAHYSDCESE